MFACLLTGLSVGSYSAEKTRPDPDPVFTPQEAFFSAVQEGLGGGGCALPWNLQSVSANPSLLYSCRSGAARISRSAVFGYGRDSLFDRYIVPFGASYSRNRNALSVNMRALSSSAGLDEYEAIVTLCRRVWRSAGPVGPVDLGANIRFEYADWKRRGFDTLASIFSFVAPSGVKIQPDSVALNGLPPESGRFRETRLFLDLGFFKPEIAQNIDCGIMLRNLAGYSRGWESPDTVRRKDTAGTVRDTVAVVRSSESYGGWRRDYSGMVPLKYAVLTGGLNFRFPNPGGKWSLCFPVDVAVYGLLDPKIEEVAAVRIGVQAHSIKGFFLRMGYSHAPGILPAGFQKVALVHNVSFGASMLLPGLPVALDFYISNLDWGINAAVDY